MKTLYLDCGMGAAGDMLTAALYELLEDEEKVNFLEKMNGMGIPEISVIAESMTKCGIVGTHMRVSVGGAEEEVEISHEHEHDHEHEHNHDHEQEHEHEHEHEQEHEHEHTHAHQHRGMDEIEHIINSLNASTEVKQNTLSVYKLIAEAESNAHGVAVSEIHFHEVGTMDAIADVTAVCLLMEMLQVKKVVASSVHVGSGHVHCMHGILPVPAPATAYILKDVPIYGGGVKGELCTPTGAALLKHFAFSFGEMPTMKVERIGYGMGKKDFSAANCVRAMLGETKECGKTGCDMNQNRTENQVEGQDNFENQDQIIGLSCNIDDMTPEKIGFAMDLMFENGALDAYTIPIGMKKSRPGVMFCVICKVETKEKIMRLIFQHTTTLGIRENVTRRYVLSREVSREEFSIGSVHIKHSEGYGVTREKYEYDDLTRIAKKKGLSIEEVVRIIQDERK